MKEIFKKNGDTLVLCKAEATTIDKILELKLIKQTAQILKLRGI